MYPEPQVTKCNSWYVFLNATQRKGFPDPVPQAVPLKGLVARCKTTNLESELRASELRV